MCSLTSLVGPHVAQALPCPPLVRSDWTVKEGVCVAEDDDVFFPHNM